MASSKVKEVIEIPAINIKEVNLTVVGDSSLIVHRFDDKSRRQILEKQMKKATSKAKQHEIKNPVLDFINSMYWLEGKPDEEDCKTPEDAEKAFKKAIENGARFGFPSIAFKSAAVSAGYRSGITKDKVSSYGAFHIDSEFAEIQGVPEIREDMVRIMGTSADIRYRGEFKRWKTIFSVKYDAGMFSLEQVINLFNRGGFNCGIGEWRPEKGGEHGKFHIE